LFPISLVSRQDPAVENSRVNKPAENSGDEKVNLESRKSTSPATNPTPRSAELRVNKTLVLINVTVTDPLNRFVTGLEREHFRLFEDKVEQQISQFSSEDAPISIGAPRHEVSEQAPSG